MNTNAIQQLKMVNNLRLFIFMELPQMNYTIICFLLSSLVFVSQALLGNETDHLALLAFKDRIAHDDPLSALASWNHTLHFCQWKGITCSRQHPRRVTVLNLAGQGLMGSLSPDLGNLSFLRMINLGNNSLHGKIPPQFGLLRQLEHINLTSNSLEGEIPANISYCLELRSIDFTGNMLIGRIPVELTSLSKLIELQLSRNSFIGTIPPTFGNLSSLTKLYLMRNSLQGSIPYDLGRLANLNEFQASLNELSGVIPPPVYNISSITIFAVARNQLKGSLPAGLGELLFPNVQVFVCGGNQFTGPIPISLSNASQLGQISLPRNYLTGSLPINLGRLEHLWWLNLDRNILGREHGNDLNIITALTNCSRLQLLKLSYNHLSGVFPDSVANLSNQLTSLSLGTNKIFGSIPTGVVNLVNLRLLDIERNLLTGSIPAHIGKLNKLEELNMSQNTFSGRIPPSIGNMTRLGRLYLSQTGLEGSIPTNLGDCKKLQVLALEENNINGTIPRQVLSFSSLFYLNLSHNSLTGSLPSEAGNIKSLGQLDISKNKLSGKIPSQLGNCLALEYLYMDGNFFEGSIPLSLSNLRGIRELDLSKNKLSGQIPKFLGTISLQYLNLSSNDLEGEVPTEGIFRNGSMMSVLGNSKLCGGVTILKLPRCSSRASNGRGRSTPLKIVVSVVSAILCLVLFTCLFAVLRWRRNPRTRALPSTSFIEDKHIKVSYAELLKATDGFSLANLIGEGSYGSVYKGVLDQMSFAVKVLKLEKQGAPMSFMAECKALRNIRHRNLVKIITSCSSIDFKGNDFKALIYEYVPNWNLETWLHPSGNVQHQLTSLSLIQRFNIAIDVAFALDYLHCQCQAPIIHRDLKPSNVLLDNDMNAHVSDFGLARFLSKDANIYSESGSKTIGIKGSIGYVAPEYGMGAEASTHGDIYSYGILLLEMFTGKRPTDDMFDEGLSLHQFVKMALPGKVMEIIDPQLLLEEDGVATGKNHSNMRGRLYDCLVSTIKVGVLCSSETPSQRMEIRDVVVEMQAIRDSYLGMRMH